MSRASENMLQTLGVMGEKPASADAAAEPEGQPGAAEAAVTSETASAPTADVTKMTIDEALAELTAAPTPQEPVAADAAPEEPAAETAESRVAALEAQVATLLAEKEELTAAEAEEQFQADWVEVVQDGKRFYKALEQQVERRGYQNGRTKAEIDAVIKHMILEGNDIERLGAPPGTPGFLEWQETTLINFAIANGERGQRKAQPSEMERLTAQYNLTADDQATLRRFANYPPEAREEVAKGLGAKNKPQTEMKAKAEETAIDNVARRLVESAAPGVPGPAPKTQRYEYQHTPDVKLRETEHFARSIGLVR
jgi:hypothetical protein